MVGIVLILPGVIALAYQGIIYTTHKKVLDIGLIQATKEEHKTILASSYRRHGANWRRSPAHRGRQGRIIKSIFALG
jgi:hypothetical protein